MEKGHTSREFERELRTLRDKLLAMGGRAEQQIARAVQAMVKRDDSLSQQVIADDASIDQDEIGIDELKEQYTIVIVTHNMQQAIRVSDFTAFFYMGELIEHGTTQQVFTRPERRATEDYVTGKFG